MEEQRINIMSEEPTQPAAQTEVDDTPKPAGITERFVALLIDWGLISFLYQLFLLWILRKYVFSLEQLYALLAGVLVPFVLYETIFSSGARNTLGKKLVGIRVADQHTGEPLGVLRAFIRSVGYVLSGGLLMCGFLLAFIDDRHRALHDYLAGSVVVQARPKGFLEKALLTLTGIVLMIAFVGYFYF